MTRFLIFLSIIASAGSLSAGLLTNDYVALAITVTLLGAVWIAAQLRGYYPFTPPAFGIFVVISLLCTWANVPQWFSLAGLIFSLLAWDLTKFFQRLQMTAHKEDVRKMERAHFARLVLIIGLSLLGYFSTTRIKVALTFGSAALLALLGIWGISALVYRLRSHE